MPQASEDLRDTIRQVFGDISPTGPCDFLKSRGFVLNIDNWSWSRNDKKQWEFLTPFERNCIDFLHEEWDFAGYHVENSTSMNPLERRIQVIAVTTTEGGLWRKFDVNSFNGRLPTTVHSLLFEDGSIWDCYNGWRPILANWETVKLFKHGDGSHRINLTREIDQ